MLYDNLNVNEKGHLSLAGYDTAELPKSTVLRFILWTRTERSRVREYKSALSGIFPQALCRICK
ncbi:MAG: hypothetical protein ACLR56_11340 [Oscillospiraceae bacterium]